MTAPEISVVIPTFNRPDLLAVCLEGFARQDVALARFEVVVVDDGSDAPLEAAIAPFRDRLDLRLERRPHRGVAAARNVGVVLARAPLLILFDDDQQALPGMVRRCLDFHVREPGEDAFRLMRVVPQRGQPRDARSIAMFERAMVFSFPREGQDWSYGGFWGGAVTCKASIFRYGLYDQTYGMAEDVELGLRIARWLPLRCLHDGIEDIAQLRTLSVREMARRWLRMAYFHLLWQRNYPGEVTVGDLPVYRGADRTLAQGRDLAALVVALEQAADALGVLDPVALAPAEAASLEDFLTGMRALLNLCQAAGWVAARGDEPLEDLLARLLP